MTAVRAIGSRAAFWCAALLIMGCQTITVQQVGDTPVINAQAEIPEEQLLDVGIHVFDGGEISDEGRVKKGLSEEIRATESRYASIRLRETVQRSGHWGAVRVLPTDTHAVDVLVKGTIRESDGESLALEVRAADASGRQWFTAVYEKAVSVDAYRDPDRQEVFQDIYNRIANDLYQEKNALSPEQLREIRRIARLRFANTLAPQAFDGYLAVTEDGQYRIQRLPAEGEPMMERVMKIREREHLLIDVVNGYYDNLYADLEEPYFGWRKARSEEAEALREIKQKATNRYLLGAALIVGAIAVEALGGSSNTDSLRDAMVLGGAYSVKRGADLSSQQEIHKDAIRELGESFAAETAPLVVNVEGQTVELTGSAEQQFQQWRDLLGEIYATETGAPLIPSDTPAALRAP
jgi:hypothetical protein